MILSTPLALPGFTCGCSLDKRQEDLHTAQPWGNRNWIVLIFIPLLALSADEMHKFESLNATWGNVGVYHLDKIFHCNCSANHKLVHPCSMIKQSMSSTLFVFLLPQFLINHPDKLSIFVTCAHECTLRLIAMEEVHIHMQHGLSFHEEICALCVKFFRRIHGNQPRDQSPRLIAPLATFPTSYLWLLLSLLTVDLCISNCILRRTVVEFCQQEFDIKLELCSKKAQFVLKGLSLVADFLQRNPDSSVVIFCNSQKQSQHILVQLEKKLDQL
jgi:hypothetical protein